MYFSPWEISFDSIQTPKTCAAAHCSHSWMSRMCFLFPFLLDVSFLSLSSGDNVFLLFQAHLGHNEGIQLYQGPRSLAFPMIISLIIEAIQKHSKTKKKVQKYKIQNGNQRSPFLPIPVLLLNENHFEQFLVLVFLLIIIINIMFYFLKNVFIFGYGGFCCCTWAFSSCGGQKERKKVKLLSRVRLFVTRWTVAYQASLSMGYSRQECWSGLPFPSPGDLPDPGIEPRVSRIAGRCFTV